MIATLFAVGFSAAFVGAVIGFVIASLCAISSRESQCRDCCYRPPVHE